MSRWYWSIAITLFVAVVPVEVWAQSPGAPRSTAAPIAATNPEGQVNINTASEEELQRLPGIGPARAAAVLALRQRLQRFRGPDDLLRVRGIGRVSLRHLRPYISVSGETTLLARPGHSPRNGDNPP